MPARSTKRIVVALLLAVVVSAGGCGRSDRGKVTGTVAHKDGSPLAGARVVARSTETGATAYGTTNQKGYVEFGGEIAPGNYDVSILEDRGDPDSRRAPTIAAKYQDATKSEIKITVKAGEATQLDLKLDPP